MLEERDWLFPSYRDTLAAVARGLDPVEALTLLRGDRHTGYDPREHRIAPLCTPLATQLPHAVGLAHAARLKGDDVVALAMVGDGGTSEGDFHEVARTSRPSGRPRWSSSSRTNGFAISVPLAKQTAAPSLAHKAVGYGMPGRLVDGNDAAAVHQVLSEAVARARRGEGPTLVEAVTYRMEAHTNADDATRYRVDSEVEAWRAHDPVQLLERELTGRAARRRGHRAGPGGRRAHGRRTPRPDERRSGAGADGPVHPCLRRADQPAPGAGSQALRAELDAEQDHEHSAEESR
ncbi:Pyruvate dehydrogenase (Acetyl-transferring) E1 component subunit alpha OS=Streptomyces microflavus OX=1919 GN=pdhA PE=4 SV=1 [Streptomyces microflavus]